MAMVVSDITRILLFLLPETKYKIQAMNNCPAVSTQRKKAATFALR